jgi:hypothetical protein
MTIIQTLVDWEDIWETKPTDWEELKEFPATGNVYWMHKPTTTLMAINMSDAHPTTAIPGEEYVLIHNWGAIQVHVLDHQEIQISLPLVNLFDRLIVTLDEAFWLSVMTSLHITVTNSDNQNTPLSFKITSHHH